MADAAARPGEQERLLIAAALADLGPARTAWLSVAPGLDIDLVAHETHGVFGQLADNLRAMGLEPEVLPRLDGVRKRLWATNSQRVRQALAAANLLELAGVRAEPTGGLAVLLLIGDLATRPLVDAELAVAQADVGRATAALADAGWAPVLTRRDGWLMDLQSSTLAKDGRSVTLRWRRGGWPYLSPSEAQHRAPTGELVRLAPAGMLLAHVLIDGFRLWGYNPTRRYADAMLLMRHMEQRDWDDLALLTQTRNAALVVTAALEVLRDDLSAAVPPELLARLAGDAVGRRSRLGLDLADRSLTTAAFVRRTAALRPLGVAAAAPAFLRDVWDVEAWHEVPAAARSRWASRRRRAADRGAG